MMFKHTVCSAYSSALIIPLGSLSDVCELQGERSGHMLDGPPADSVEERGETVAPPQPGTFPKTGGEWRTLIFNLCVTAL